MTAFALLLLGDLIFFAIPFFGFMWYRRQQKQLTVKASWIEFMGLGLPLLLCMFVGMLLLLATYNAYKQVV